MNSSRIKQLTEFLKDSPEDSFLIFALAKELEKQGNEEEAIAQFNKLKELDANYVGLYYHLAALLAKKNDDKLTLNVYNEGISIAEKLGDSHALAELKNAKMNFEIELD